MQIEGEGVGLARLERARVRERVALRTVRVCPHHERDATIGGDVLQTRNPICERRRA